MTVDLIRELSPTMIHVRVDGADYCVNAASTLTSVMAADASGHPIRHLVTYWGETCARSGAYQLIKQLADCVPA